MSVKNYSNILIDGTNFFLRTYESCNSKVDIVDNILSQPFEESYRRLRDIESQYLALNGKIFILFDNPLSAINRRKQLSGGQYKSNRSNYPIIVYKTIDFFKFFVVNLGREFNTLSVDGFEADDLVKKTLNLCDIDSLNQVLLISADMDWSRFVSQDVHWFNYSKIFTPKIFENTYGFEPSFSKVHLYKTFRGDRVDCIPNAVPNLREDILLKIIEEPNLEVIFKKCIRADYGNWSSKILDAKHELELNYKLINLIEPSPENINSNIVWGRSNPKLAEHLASSFKLKLDFDSEIDEDIFMKSN